MNKRKQIYELAKKARTRAEIQATKSKAFGKDLNGFCGRGSCILHDYLSKNNIVCEIVWSDQGHAFVIAEGYIVDITASQFKRHKIIVKSIDYSDEWYWQRNKTFKTINDFIKWQKDFGWAPYETGNENDFIKEKAGEISPAFG